MLLNLVTIKALSISSLAAFSVFLLASPCSLSYTVDMTLWTCDVDQ